MRCGTIGSCQSAATSEIVKALLVTSPTHVSGTITSFLTFTFSFIAINAVVIQCTVSATKTDVCTTHQYYMATDTSKQQTSSRFTSQQARGVATVMP